MNYLGNSANRIYMPAGVLAALLAVILTRRSFVENLPAAEDRELGFGEQPKAIADT